MALETVFDYFRKYDKSTYQVAACMGNEPSEEDVQKFEQSVNVRLPGEFRKFTMSSLGGLYMEVREEIWPQAKQFDIGPFWSFCRGIIVYGIAEGIPEYLDIRVRTSELHEMGFTEYIPFLSVIGNGDEIFCFDNQGTIFLLDYYETEEAHIVEGTFSQCLMQQIQELEERKERKLRGEDLPESKQLP